MVHNVLSGMAEISCSDYKSFLCQRCDTCGQPRLSDFTTTAAITTEVTTTTSPATITETITAAAATITEAITTAAATTTESITTASITTTKGRIF